MLDWVLVGQGLGRIVEGLVLGKAGVVGDEMFDDLAVDAGFGG